MNVDTKGGIMNLELKKSVRCAFILMICGMLALYGGPVWSIGLIPVAALIWFTTKPQLRSGQNRL